MSVTLNHQPSTAEWRRRFGLVGTHGNCLIIRRGDLFGSISHSAIQARDLYEVLQRLGERFCYRDLLGAFGSGLPEKEVLQIIGYLKNEAGVITAPIPDVPDNELLISDSSGGFLDPSSYCQLNLALSVDSDDHRDELIRLVHAIIGRSPKMAGIEECKPIRADAVLLCTQGMNTRAIQEVAERLDEQGLPWFSVADFGSSARAGPFNSVPQRQGVCCTCLDTRLSNASLPSSPAAAKISRHFTMAAILGIHQLVRLVAAPSLAGTSAQQVFSVMADLSIRKWRVAPMPGCDVCGTKRSPKLSVKRVMRKRVAEIYADAELRDFRWQTALERYRAHTGPLDVIQTVRHTRHPQLAGISMCAATVSALEGTRDDPAIRTFLGVGVNEGSAELASLARSMERLSLCQDSADSRVTASAQEIGPEALLPSTWGPELARYDQATLAWTKAYSLFDNGERFVPSNCVFFPYCAEHGEEEISWTPHSVGTGCDLSLGGALLWALLELVETDAMLRIDSHGITGEAVDLSVSDTDPQVSHLIQALQVSGYRVFLKDCSLDLGIPVIAAAVVAEGSSRLVSRGSCAHLCGTYAVRHALREAVRCMIRPQDRELNCEHLLGSSGEDRHVRLPDLSMGSVHDDLELVLNTLRRVSPELFAMDMTRRLLPGSERPGNEIYCVRVITPYLIGPMSTANSRRMVAFDPDEIRTSRAHPQVHLAVVREATDDGPIDAVRCSQLTEPTSASPQALGDQLIVTLGRGVLADLVNERLEILDSPVSSYSEVNTLLCALDDERIRPGIVIAALGEMPAKTARHWNAESYVRGQPWIAFTQRGDDVECGPLVRGSPHPGCYWCIRMHAYSNNASVARWERKNELIPDSAGGIFHAGARLAVEFLLGEVASVFSGIVTDELKVRRFAPNEEISEERFGAIPKCPVCGSLADRASLQLGSVNPE